MTERKELWLRLPATVIKIAKMGSARLGITASEYIAGLILEDGTRTKIAALLEQDGADDEERCDE